MSMRVHDLQHPYLHKHYKHGRAMGPDPVNIVLLAGIFVLSTFFVYSVVTTMRYVPALETQRGLTPLTVSSVQGAVNSAGSDPGAGQHKQESDPIYTQGGLTPSTGTQSKPWYEKPPYVREGLLSERIAGYRTFKETAQLKTSQSGILK